MKFLKITSAVFAVISSIIAIIGTILMLSRKLKPTRRIYPDRPEIWVKVGFWSYVLIHWLMVYTWRAADGIVLQDRGINFYAISRGTSTLARNSLGQLNEIEIFPIEKPTLKIKERGAVEKIGQAIGMDVLKAKIKNLDEKIESTNDLVEPFTALIQLDNVDICLSVFSSDEISHTFGSLSNTVKKMELDSKSEKLTQIGTELIQAFRSDAILMESGKKVKKSVDDKKGLLMNFVSDMQNLEFHRKELIEELQPKTVDKVWWIQQFTYAEIFVSLAFSVFIYLGFGRMEEMMGVRWPARLCAISVPLSAANILVFSAFMLWVGTFTCPSEAEKIGLDRFTTKWKPPHSSSFPTKICQSAEHTIFSGLEDRVDFSITIDDIENQMKSDVDRIRTNMDGLKYDFFSNEIVEIEKLLIKMKEAKECSGASASSALSELIVGLGSLVEDGKDIENIMNWNGTIVLEPILESLYRDSQVSIERSMKTIESKIQATDIPCKSIEWKINQCRQLVCEELDIELDENWLILDVVLFFLVALFCLNIVVYRTVALWEIENHSPPPPPPPQPPVRVLRRYRARRLDAHVF